MSIGNGRIASPAATDRYDTSVTEGYSGSDHVPFKYSAEIPVISFFGNDMSRINTRRVTIESINPVLLGETAVLILDLLASLEDL